MPTARDTVVLVVALASVSFSGPLMAAAAAPALAIASWRNGLGAAATAAAALTRQRAELRRLALRPALAAAAAGIALAVHFSTWVPSVTMTTVAAATALVSTQSVFVPLIAVAMGRRMPRAVWLGIGVAVIGAALITGADIGLSARALAGDGLAVIGGFAAAVYVTIGERVRASMSTLSYTTICYSVAAAILLVVCLVGGVPLTGYSGNAWLKLALIAITAQLLGHSLINVALRTTSATVVSLVLLFETPGAAIVAFGWLGQRPPWTAVPGIVALLAGLVVVTRARGRGVEAARRGAGGDAR
ncbi:MAG: DMT family transporter [Actinomycetia bacterium]|nr:DMT family transporter [Actinomycetes bacterium]